MMWLPTLGMMQCALVSLYRGKAPGPHILRKCLTKRGFSLNSTAVVVPYASVSRALTGTGPVFDARCPGEMIAVPPDVWGVGWECVSVLPCLKEGLVTQYFESEKGHELAANFDMDSLVKISPTAPDGPPIE